MLAMFITPHGASTGHRLVPDLETIQLTCSFGIRSVAPRPRPFVSHICLIRDCSSSSTSASEALATLTPRPRRETRNKAVERRTSSRELLGAYYTCYACSACSRRPSVQAVELPKPNSSLRMYDWRPVVELELQRKRTLDDDRMIDEAG